MANLLILFASRWGIISAAVVTCAREQKYVTEQQSASAAEKMPHLDAKKKKEPCENHRGLQPSYFTI